MLIYNQQKYENPFIFLGLTTFLIVFVKKNNHAFYLSAQNTGLLSLHYESANDSPRCYGRTFLPDLVEHFAVLVEHYVKTCQKRPFFRLENTAQWKSTGDVFFCFMVFCIFAL